MAVAKVVLDEDAPGAALSNGKGGVSGSSGGSDVLLPTGGEIGLQTAEGAAGTEHGEEVAPFALQQEREGGNDIEHGTHTQHGA